MQALIILTLLLLNPFAYGQETTAAPATPAATAEQPTTPPADSPEVDTTTAEESGTVMVSENFRSGILVSPSITMYKRKLDQSGANLGDFNNTTVDLRAGYVFDFGLFAGIQAAYNFGKDAANDITTYLMGPTVGYSCKWTGVFVTATYHLMGKSDMDTAGEYDEITGLQVDLGYPLMLTETIKIGPQLSWKRLKYSDGGVLGDYKSKEVIPSLGLWFYF